MVHQILNPPNCTSILPLQSLLSSLPLPPPRNLKTTSFPQAARPSSYRENGKGKMKPAPKEKSPTSSSHPVEGSKARGSPWFSTMARTLCPGDDEDLRVLKFIPSTYSIIIIGTLNFLDQLIHFIIPFPRPTLQWSLVPHPSLLYKGGPFSWDPFYPLPPQQFPHHGLSLCSFQDDHERNHRCGCSENSNHRIGNTK